MTHRTTIWTLGHSSRDWGAFVSILREHSIEAVCDVRSWPGSRKFPHFAGETMRAALADVGIAYEWMGRELGGHRKTGLGDLSPNIGLADARFRHYADYMQSERFQQGLDALLLLAREKRTAVMCAEALPARCHRGVLSDALVARGVRVVHLLDPGNWREHPLSREARIEHGIVTYPLSDDLFG